MSAELAYFSSSWTNLDPVQNISFISLLFSKMAYIKQKNTKSKERGKLSFLYISVNKKKHLSKDCNTNVLFDNQITTIDILTKINKTFGECMLNASVYPSISYS